MWTDVGVTSSGPDGFNGVTFQAFDAMGNSLGTIGPVTLGDGSVLGGTAEDRFFGVMHSGGISEIRITMSSSTDWEVDHLQFGSTAQAVPEPATMLLLATGLAGIAAKRFKRPKRQ